MYKCIHFNIKELVSPVVYNKWGEKAWMFFDDNYLIDLDYIRESYGKAIIINNWASGGSLKQCGLRSNMDDIVKSKKTLYLSGHVLAKAFDLHDSKGNNSLLWDHCYKLRNSGKLRAFKRLESKESAPTWVHLDGLNDGTTIFKDS